MTPRSVVSGECCAVRGDVRAGRGSRIGRGGTPVSGHRSRRCLVRAMCAGSLPRPGGARSIGVSRRGSITGADRARSSPAQRQASGDHVLPVDGGSARDLRAAVIAAGPARQLTDLTPPPTGPTPARRLRAGDFSLSCPEEDQSAARDRDGFAFACRWSSPVGRREVRQVHQARLVFVARIGGSPGSLPIPDPKDENPSEGAHARASALSDLWAGRLVDRGSCGALSTGVTAGPRVLQSLVAGADRIAAPRSRPLVIGLRLPRGLPGYLLSADGSASGCQGSIKAAKAASSAENGANRLPLFAR
jgi:hypothetical protein